MDEKEKYLAEIETRMQKFHQTFHEIKERAQDSHTELGTLKMNLIPGQMEEADRRVEAIRRAGKGEWQQYEIEMKDLLDGIDAGLRKALAYFG